MSSEVKVNHYVWKGPELRAELCETVDFPNGGVFHQARIGQVSIFAGDIIHLDYGRSMGVSTSSGRGYQSEFPHGKVTLAGTSASTILQNYQPNDYEIISSTKVDYDAKVAKQKERILPDIQVLKDIFIFNEMEKRARLKLEKEEQEKRNKEKIAQALGKMNDAFGTKSTKP